MVQVVYLDIEKNHLRKEEDYKNEDKIKWWKVPVECLDIEKRNQIKEEDYKTFIKSFDKKYYLLL